MLESSDVLTTSNGAPVDSLTASLTAGPRGTIPLKVHLPETYPIVDFSSGLHILSLQDFVLIDHLAAFDRERIPERVVHAKGAGAFGFFEVTSDDIQKICKADLFSSVGKKTRVAVRFSTVFAPLKASL